MNTMDVHASLNNLLQMDRHQEETNRIPVSHQTANAQTEREDAAHRIEMPNQPDQAEGKDSDSASSKHYRGAPGRRQPRHKKKNTRGKIDGAGRFVDVTV